jgi:thymidylate kinase
MKKQQIIIFEGVDMCGKTEISKKLSKKLKIPRFKAINEHDVFLDKKDKFLHHLRYADPRVVDLLGQTKQSIIFDRTYPSEYVYSQILNRQSDFASLRFVDDEYAKLDTKIIICKRKSYCGIQDDLDSSINEEVLTKLDKMYDEFATWTKCKVLKLYVDDENLKREIKEILEFINVKN